MRVGGERASRPDNCYNSALFEMIDDCAGRDPVAEMNGARWGLERWFPELPS